MDRRWIARLAVLALHLGLFAALWSQQPPVLDAPGEHRMTTIRLLPLRPAPAPQPKAKGAPLAAPRQAATPPPRIVEAPAAAAAPAVPTAPPPVASPEPPRMTLRLALPPGYAASAARNPALADPRSNSPRATLESRIADATRGAGDWVEERTSDNRNQAVGALGEHRRVMRRGNTCVEVFRSRIGDSDPFNGNVAPIATSMVGKPYQCK